MLRRATRVAPLCAGTSRLATDTVLEALAAVYERKYEQGGPAEVALPATGAAGMAGADVPSAAAVVSEALEEDRSLLKDGIRGMTGAGLEPAGASALDCKADLVKSNSNAWERPSAGWAAPGPVFEASAPSA